MELETIRCLVDGLNDPTIGINAMIDALGLESGDVTPPHVTVYDSARHGWLARRAFALANLDVTMPALAVMVQSIDVSTPEIETVVREAYITITVADLDENSATQTANYSALQRRRALLRFLSRFSANGNLAMRTRNGVIVRCITEIKPESVAAVKDDVFIGATTDVTFLVRETAP
jgi:hypothetical protein